VPLALILMLLMGLCPLLPWRGKDRTQLWKDVAWTASPAVILLVVLLAIGLRKPYTLLSFTLATFTVVSILLQYGRGWRNRRKAAGTGWLRAFGGMVWNNRSRYGGFLAHLGLIIVLVGITGSNAFKQVADGELSKGGSLSVGRFELTYDDLAFEEAADKQMARATFTVSRDGEVVGQVNPVKEYYFASEQVWTRVDLHSSLVSDFYVSLLGYEENGTTVSVRAEINPLVIWLWIGGGVLVAGGLLALWPSRGSRERANDTSRKTGSKPRPKPKRATVSTKGGADE
jgi:cytochrome c-type biogenesis protein CcmF